VLGRLCADASWAHDRTAWRLRGETNVAGVSHYAISNMPYKVTPEPAAERPWLEHYCAKGSLPEKTSLEEFPFTIGRNPSAKLQIDSARVSREHAVIVREDDAYRIRDLGSTNGTCLNGRRIDEAVLADGDVLLIANVEFGFFCRSSRVARSTVTQVIGVGQSAACASGTGREDFSQGIIRAVRRLQEMTVRRSIRIGFEPIVSLTGGRPMGYEALVKDEGWGQSEADRAVVVAECRLTGRLSRLRRLIAAEEAARLPQGVFLFVGLDSSEIGSDWLLESLGKLQASLSGGRRLVVGLPEGAASDVPHCRDFRGRLRDLGIGIAYDGYSSGGGQLLRQTEILPDFVKLNGALVRGLGHNLERQRQVQSIVNAGRELGCEIIAAGVTTEEDARICRRLGCRFGQGDLFATPQPAGSPHAPADACIPSGLVTSA